MSHSSGIAVSQALSDTFGEALTSEKTRFVKVQISNDELIPTGTLPLGSDYEADLDLIPSHLDEKDPCYILFRLDSRSPQGWEWVLMCYVPDKSKVRDKMTYASTRSNLRKQLGSSNFVYEIFGTVAGDFNREGYKAFVTMQKSETPLTWTERQSIQEKEQGVYVGGASTAYVHGVAFPVATDVVEALQSLQNDGSNYVQVAIDVEKEQIILDRALNLESIDDLGGQVPLGEPRFHFFRYDHEFDGEDLKSVIMVYSCPDGSGSTKSAPVKMRMLYSSSKANVESIFTSTNGKIATKMEVNQGSEVTGDSINALLHPQKEEEKKAFAKPKGPSKGGKRLIRK